jgi:hypothetical protein
VPASLTLCLSRRDRTFIVYRDSCFSDAGGIEPAISEDSYWRVNGQVQANRSTNESSELLTLKIFLNNIRESRGCGQVFGQPTDLHTKNPVERVNGGGTRQY